MLGCTWFGKLTSMGLFPCGGARGEWDAYDRVARMARAANGQGNVSRLLKDACVRYGL